MTDRQCADAVLSFLDHGDANQSITGNSKPVNIPTMREHGFLPSPNRPNASHLSAVLRYRQYLPRPARGGGQVLFRRGPWPGVEERLWYVAPFNLDPTTG